MRNNKTERQLWGTLSRGVASEWPQQRARFTRFEVDTEVGVADVEYVAPGWHGWIELKATATVRPDSPLRCGHPFTAAQCAWLLAHHAPGACLRSWLLIGISGRVGWRGFLLLDALHAVSFLRPVPPTLNALQGRGIVAHDNITTVLRALVSTDEKEK